MSFSLTEISISSLGYPEILTLEIPFIAFKSSSISSAVFLSWLKATSPFIANEIAGLRSSIKEIEGDSISSGKELILSIAFLIS